MWDAAALRNPVHYPGRYPSAKAIRIADVFCGAGGLSYGVRDAIRACGFRCEVILAVDVDQVTIEVYRRNIDPALTSRQDVYAAVTTSYTYRADTPTFASPPQLMADELRSGIGKVDILLGGPPCQGHSTSNNHTRRMDPRNKYYLAMPALAVVFDANTVIVENVPGVLHDHREVLGTAKSLFETSGYYVSEAIVDATDLGLPQTRKRHILVASKVRKPHMDTNLQAVRRGPRDLEWAIGDLRDVDFVELLDTPPELSEVNKQRIRYLFENEEYDLPNHQRPPSHQNGHTYPSIYGRLRWDRPSGTITTGFNTPGRGRYIHPDRERTITAHEAARIQGFPDPFEFKLINGATPTRASLAKMIGDAVPPQMGYAAGIAALASMVLHQ